MTIKQLLKKLKNRDYDGWFETIDEDLISQIEPLDNQELYYAIIKDFLEMRIIEGEDDDEKI